jgi:DNA (cytosine-5)-methyltransferase 1
MLTPQFLLPIHRELVVDLFAGGGGASTGIEQAIGRPVDIAVNHDPEAISLHEVNHPQTRHFISDVFEVDPVAVTSGQPVGGLWLSPDCKHFSKAKGGKPVSKNIRGLAWIAIKWIKALKPTHQHPRVIWLENVEEFQTWGPLGEDDRPCPLRKGETFNEWVGELRALGYRVEWRELRACDYGAPTIRRRLFLVARRDGLPIVWPEPTHGRPGSPAVMTGKLKPWRTAAECIDWSIPCPSIFERKKPLADATCRRIAAGIMRYVVNAAEPFIVPIGYGEREGQQPRTASIRQPLATAVGSNKHALVTAFLAKHYTGVVGSSLTDPMGTVTSVDHHSLVTSHLVKLRGDNVGGPVTEPLHTISAQGTHHGEVRAFLVKCYSEGGQDQSLADPMHTIPTKDRMGLVTVTIAGEEWVIVDIGLRMLTPKELYPAQGFPANYRFETGATGERFTKTAQVRMCGNSVCPPLAQALVQANYSESVVIKEAA